MVLCKRVIETIKTLSPTEEDKGWSLLNQSLRWPEPGAGDGEEVVVGTRVLGHLGYGVWSYAGLMT